LSSPKIVASADYWPSMRTHEITSGTGLQPYIRSNTSELAGEPTA
jgi:hypothetical protein